MLQKISWQTIGESLSSEDRTNSFWRRGDLSYKLDSLQESIRDRIRAALYNIALVLSSRQIGKSFLATDMGVEECIIRPTHNVVRILSPTLKQTSDIVNDNLAKIILDAPRGFVQRIKSEHRWIIGHAELRLGSLDRANVDSNRGGNSILAIYEEGGFVPSEDLEYACQSVIGPQLIRHNGREIHITSPSDDPFHYIHEVIKPKCENNGTFFQHTIYDSPSVTEHQIKEAIERCGGIDTDGFKREFLAQIIRSSTLTLVPEFEESKHVAEYTVPEYFTHCISIDLGGSKDFTAVLFLVYDFVEHKVFVVDELWISPNTAVMDITPRCIELEGKYGLKTPVRWMDAHGQTHVDISRDYPCRQPNNQDPLSGIHKIRRMLSAGQLYIHPQCPNLIQSLKMARWATTRKEDFIRNDVIGHCDMIAALIYGIRTIDMHSNPFPEKPIDRDTQMRIAYRSKPSQLEAISNKLMPYSPMRKP